MTSARDRLRSRAGQSLPEYVVLLALVAIGLVVILVGLGSNVQTIYTATNRALAAAVSGITGGGGDPPSGSVGIAGGGGSTSGGGGGSTAGGGGSSDPGGGSSSGGGGGGAEDPPPETRPISE
jgi:Flp pilus assembly pilin Flp